jgi:ABC-type bacteriocin/lantibiotic exporter with double-glycine peptidase domain
MSEKIVISQDPNNYWEQLERLEKLIRASELKAGVIFSFHSLILGLFADKIEYFQEIFKYNMVLVALVILWIVCVLISIYFCFKCFMPRLETKIDKNVFFFKDAVDAFGSMEDYTKKLMSVCNSEEEFFKMLSEQIYIESKIIDLKFSSVQKSIRFFAASFFVVVLMLVIWLVAT